MTVQVSHLSKMLQIATVRGSVALLKRMYGL